MDFPQALGAQFPYRLVIPAPDRCESNVSSAAGAVWTVNDAAFVPFEVDSPLTVVSMQFLVTVQNGNFDIGIYTMAGTRLASLGSVAVGAAGIQVANIADLLLARGRYYAAWATSSATATIQEVTPKGGASVGAAALAGARRMATAFPLPATATFVVPTRTTMPLISLETAA